MSSNRQLAHHPGYRLELLGEGRVYFAYGPIQLTALAYRHGRPMNQPLRQVVGALPRMMEQLVGELAIARQYWPSTSPKTGNYSRVLTKMLAAVTASNDRSLTPMAAVAGAFGDCVADDMVDAGATKVIVNNGGDIALRLASGETARVGITPRVGSTIYSHCIALSHEEKVGGVSTSGLGGRSLTLGIADAVTVMARSASLADACTTSIANHTDVAHPAVVREPATRVDPQTDIADYWVTTRVGRLPNHAIYSALDNGGRQAERLLKDNIIFGVIIFVAGHMRAWPESLKVVPA